MDSRPMPPAAIVVQDEANVLFRQAVQKMFACYDTATTNDDWQALDRDCSALLSCLFRVMDDAMEEVIERNGPIRLSVIAGLVNTFVRQVAETTNDTPAVTRQ